MRIGTSNGRAGRRLFAALLTAAAIGGALAPVLRARGEAGEIGLATAVIAVPAGAAWTVDPQDPGPNLPPEGTRSLFDFVIADRERGVYEIPFPFSALLARIEARLGVAAGGPSPFEKVLIPLGRSLQRNAGAPEFFHYPRAVASVAAQPPPAAGQAGLLLEDRLFLGYQERAGVIEVISYNEGAGRFEFQLVKGYRPGGEPRVFYANRAICTACHQGAAPIFARQLWDETNANVEIRRLLKAEQRDFYGFPLDQGVDVPYRFDIATDRANHLAAYQLLWREGCGGGEGPAAVRCREAALVAALQQALAGGRGFDRTAPRFREDLAPALARAFAERWPGGLLLPDPDIPNRDPLLPQAAGVAVLSVPASLGSEGSELLTDVVRRSQVPAHFEPLNPRPPLEVWRLEESYGGGREVGDGHLPGPGAVERLVSGLGEMMAAADLRRLDAALFARGVEAGAPRERLVAPCSVTSGPWAGGGERVKLSCAGQGADGASGMTLGGRLYVEGGRITGGHVERLGSAAGELVDLEVTGGTVREQAGERVAALEVAQKTSGLHARLPNGRSLVGVELAWRPGEGSGRAEALLQDDFARLEEAVATLAERTLTGASDALADRPFRRAAVLAELFAGLGEEPLEGCCLDDFGIPPPVLEDGAGRDAEVFAEAGIRNFFLHCSLCHDTPEPSPPNFLHGPPEQIEANLAHCAERIFFRLEMWRLDPTAQPKTPMPPVNALPALGLSRETWPADPDLAALRDYVATLLAADAGRAPRLDDLDARGYDRLRSCLPDAG